LLLNASQHAVKPDIGSESRYLPTPPALNAPVGGGSSCRNNAMPFGVEKLEWCGYPMVKKFLCLFVLTESMNVTDTHTHTDRHCMTAKAARRACIASRGKKSKTIKKILSNAVTYIILFTTSRCAKWKLTWACLQNHSTLNCW